MKHLGKVRLLAVAAILLAGAQSFAQTSVNYRCRRPRTGCPAVTYRWYICWPDSNTLTLKSTSSDTFATVVHQHNGERVRAVAVDAMSRAGPRSVASKAWSLIIATDVPIANAWRLYPAYPNPFNPRTSVDFELPEAQRARVAIYAIDGRLINVLVDAQLPAGRHTLAWAGVDAEGRAVASGVYVCRLETAGRAQSVRLTLVK